MFDKKSVTAWLKKTPDGRKLLQGIVAWALRRRLAQERRVLIVLRRLGKYPGAEVYCEPGASVKVIELPDLPDDDPIIEPLIEGLIREKLPQSWRGMVELPARRKSSEVFRAYPPERFLWARNRTAAIKAMSSKSREFGLELDAIRTCVDHRRRK